MAKAKKIRSVLTGLGLLAPLAAAPLVFCQAAAAEVLAGSLYSFAVEPLTPGERGRCHNLYYKGLKDAKLMPKCSTCHDAPTVVRKS